MKVISVPDISFSISRSKNLQEPVRITQITGIHFKETTPHLKNHPNPPNVWLLLNIWMATRGLTQMMALDIKFMMFWEVSLHLVFKVLWMWYLTQFVFWNLGPLGWDFRWETDPWHNATITSRFRIWSGLARSRSVFFFSSLVGFKGSLNSCLTIFVSRNQACKHHGAASLWERIPMCLQCCHVLLRRGSSSRLCSVTQDA